MDESDFRDWLDCKGADDDFISRLYESGFTSKLSLRFLDISSEDGKALCGVFNYGQRCLLTGLIELCKKDVTAPAGNFTPDPFKIASAVSKGIASRSSEVSSLFPQMASSSSENSQTNQPKLDKGKPKSKSKNKGGTPKRAKIPTYTFKVVSVDQHKRATPTSAYRNNHLKMICVEKTADEAQVLALIMVELNVPVGKTVRFMYTTGRSMRLATLDDISGASSWDAATLFALHGNGHLYAAVVDKDTSPDTGSQPAIVVHSDSSSAGSPVLVRKPKQSSTVELGVDSVLQVFPQTPDKYARSLVLQKGVHGAIEFLCDRNSSSSSGDDFQLPKFSCGLSVMPSHGSSSYKPFAVSEQSEYAPSTEGLVSPISIQQAIRQHVGRVCTLHQDVFMTVNRCQLWQKAEALYKAAQHDLTILKKNLAITFHNEPGVDCGAIKSEFFTLLLAGINERLFEGIPTRRVPRRDVSLQEDFEVAGMAVAHSIMQGGPSFSCLSPAIYPLVLEEDCGIWCNYLPTREDIPHNAATASLIEFIAKMNVANSNGEVNTLLDEAQYMALVNASGWPTSKVVDVNSKNDLLQQLLVNEVIRNRAKQMQLFRRGLKILGFHQLVLLYPNKSEVLFLHQQSPFTGKQFLELVTSPEPEQQSEKTAYQYFVEYAANLPQTGSEDKPCASDLLAFVTSCAAIPPLGFKDYLTVKYLSFDSAKKLPEASSCFGVLYLPVCNASKEQFESSFDKALVLGRLGFGLN